MSSVPAARRRGSTRHRIDGSVLDGLNPEQRAAVEQTDGPLLILAGAGLRQDARHRLSHRPPDRLGPGAGASRSSPSPSPTRRPRRCGSASSALLGTRLPAACGSRRSTRCAPAAAPRRRRRSGSSRDFVIYDSSDQQSAVKQAIKERQRRRQADPAAAGAVAHQPGEEPDGGTRVAWPATRRGTSATSRSPRSTSATSSDPEGERRASTSTTCCSRRWSCSSKSEPVRQALRDAVPLHLVDEYQDTNRPQYLLVQQLASVHGNLAVVGDPDQSIYKWRGADVKNILDFERDFPEAADRAPRANYRSTQVILDAASAVIRQNRQRKDKRLWTDRSGGETIVYYRARRTSSRKRTSCCARSATSSSPTTRRTSVAVLYRMNAQSRAIEDALTREGTAVSRSSAACGSTSARRSRTRSRI